MKREELISIFEYIAKVSESCGNELIYSITMLDSCMEKSLEAVKEQILNATVDNKFDELTKLGEYCKGIQEMKKQLLDCSSAICLLSDEKILPPKPDPENIRYLPNGYIDYASYAVDSTIKHTLDEDFVHSRVSAFEFSGVKHNVTTWQEILLKLSEILYAIDSEKMKSFVKDPEMQGSRNAYFSYFVSYDNMGKPRNKKISGTDLYVFTSQSANSIVSLIKKIIKQYDISPKEITVFLKADYKELHQ